MTYSIDVVDDDIVNQITLFDKIYNSIPKDTFGCGIVNWELFYPSVNHKVTRDEFRRAIEQHTATKPLLIKTNFIVGEGQELARPKVFNSRNLFVVNKFGRQLKDDFEPYAVGSIPNWEVLYSTDSNPIRWGDRLHGGHRSNCPMDSCPIYLKRFGSDEFNNRFIALCVAEIYAALTGDGDHPLCRFVNAKTIAKLKLRGVIFINNLIIGHTQSGKSKEMFIAVILAPFMGLDSIAIFRNNGCDEAKDTFFEDYEEFLSLVESYFVDVLCVNPARILKAFETIVIGTDAKELANVTGPRVYVAGANVQNLKKATKYLLGRPFAVAVDEVDEFQCSVEATLGKTEDVFFNGENEKSIFKDATLSTCLTATPTATISFKPASIESDMETNLIKMPIPENYVGYYRSLSENRRIRIIQVQDSIKLTHEQKTQLDGFKMLLASNPGYLTTLKKMEEDYVQTGYVSCLAACSTLHRNDNKDFAAKGSADLFGTRFPAVTMSHDMSEEKKIYYAPWFHDQLTNAGFVFTGEMILAGHSVTITDRAIEVAIIKTINSSKKQEKRTVKVMYDIIMAFYEYISALLGFEVEPFIICASFGLANRGTTFKTSKHTFPLTHMYVSAKTKGCANCADAKQVAGRLCGRDDIDRVRYLFATSDFIKLLNESYTVEDEIVDIYKEEALSFEAVLETVSSTGAFAHNVHQLVRKRPMLVKTKFDRELKRRCVETIPRAHNHEYTFESAIGLAGPSFNRVAEEVTQVVQNPLSRIEKRNALARQELAVMCCIEENARNWGWFSASDVHTELVEAELIVPLNFPDNSRPFFRSGAEPKSRKGEITRALRGLAHKGLIIEDTSSKPFRFKFSVV